MNLTFIKFCQPRSGPHGPRSKSDPDNSCHFTTSKYITVSAVIIKLLLKMPYNLYLYSNVLNRLLNMDDTSL